MKLPFLEEGLNSHNLERAVDNGLHHITRTLVQRSSSDDSSSSESTCKPGDDSPKCVTPASVQNTQTLAIILGVVIPLSCAVIVLIFLHRRHLKKQRLEDQNDPHKSLDFGMDGIEPTISKNSKRKGGPKGPEMTITEVGPASMPSRRNHGLSMDMNMTMGSPYLLPAGLQGSRESIHSMSRSMMDEHDPYRPVTMMRPSVDNDSMRFGRLNDDKGSLYSMSTGQHSTMRDNAGLIANARPMSQSFGKRADSMSPQDSTHSSGEFPPRQMHSSMRSNGTPSRKASVDKELPDISEAFPSPPTPPSVPEPVALQMPPRSSSTSANSAPPPPRKDSMSTIHTAQRPESSNYGDDEPAPVGGPIIKEPEPYDIDPTMIYYEAPPPPPTLQAPPPGKGQAQDRLSVAGPQSNRLSVMGMRPLPPDVPDDNPEVRANRIRSFYKEYFDDSKPNPSAGHYYDDDDDYNFLDGVIYDPDSGGFYAPGAKPFAQGPGRRAMTPPPRARPRVSGNSNVYPHQRKFSTYSARPRGRSLPRKKLPPPSPLQSLPTPHMLKEDSMVFNPIDFAPPTSIRELQNGRRPDSPLGVQRPYSPSVRAFTPLASSFENLAVLPSPHDLRKSGTFTALDFAPPSKIRDPAGSLSPSDAGSIRSNRSGISAVQMSAVRDGAYRVSRIPKEMVTTRDDLNAQLRPKMDMISPA